MRTARGHRLLEIRARVEKRPKLGHYRSSTELPSNASLAESPIDVLLWTFPLKSHSPTLVEPSQATLVARLAPPGDAAVNNERGYELTI